MFEELLSRIGTYLSKHALPYMIIGGQAVLLYGEPRMTRGIDVTLGIDTDRLADLLGRPVQRMCSDLISSKRFEVKATYQGEI